MGIPWVRINSTISLYSPSVTAVETPHGWVLTVGEYILTEPMVAPRAVLEPYLDKRTKEWNWRHKIDGLPRTRTLAVSIPDVVWQAIPEKNVSVYLRRLIYNDVDIDAIVQNL